MNRLLFSKTGDGIFISHLDLMRVFQRAFKRGGMHLKHTQGFNPRAMVSIALPLSVGVESTCEVLDFELVDQEIPFDEIKERLNATMPVGISVISVYDSPKKVKELAYLDCSLCLEYDSGVPDQAENLIRTLFSRNEVIVARKSKKGPVEENIIPMISSLEISRTDCSMICIKTRICAQNPSLNPNLILSAIETECPEIQPDFSRIYRDEIYSSDGKVFR